MATLQCLVLENNTYTYQICKNHRSI